MTEYLYIYANQRGNFFLLQRIWSDTVSIDESGIVVLDSTGALSSGTLTHESATEPLTSNGALDNGSVLRFSDIVDNGDRFIFPKDWLETYIISNLYELPYTGPGDSNRIVIAVSDSIYNDSGGQGWLDSSATVVSTLMWVGDTDTNVNSFQYMIGDQNFEVVSTLILMLLAPSM